METQGFSRAWCYKLIRNAYCPQPPDIVQQLADRVRGLRRIHNLLGAEAASTYWRLHDCMCICAWAWGLDSFQSLIPRPWGGIAFKWIPLSSYSSKTSLCSSLGAWESCQDSLGGLVVSGVQWFRNPPPSLRLELWISCYLMAQWDFDLKVLLFSNKTILDSHVAVFLILWLAFINCRV